MKTILKLQLLSLMLLCVPGFAHAQGTAFTYNGRLNNNGAPVTGLYDLRVTLYDASAAGSVVAGPLPIIPVGITNGLFAVALDFGAGVFVGPARWLSIELRPTGGGVFTTLLPRQEVTSSPYAIQAQTAGTAASVANGAVTAGQLDTGGLPPAPGQVLSYNGGNLFWSDPAGSIWSQLNNNAYYNAGNVGIGTTTPSTYGHGGTARILEVNNSGTTLNSQAHLMLYSGVSSLADSAMGTVTWAQPGGMAAYIGAQTRSTTPNAPAAMLSFGTRKIGDGAATPKMVITEDGKVGIGTLTPNYKLDVFSDVTTAIFGRSTAVSGVGVFGESSQFNGVRGLAHNANHGGVVGVHDGGGIAVYGTGAVGVQGDSSSANGFGGYFRNTAGGITLGVEGVTQLYGQDTLQLIGYNPFLTLYDGNAGYARSRIQGVGGDVDLFTESYLNGSDSTAFLKLANNGNVGIGSPSPVAKLDVATTTAGLTGAKARTTSGTAIIGHSDTASGVVGQSSTGVGVYGIGSLGQAIYAEGNAGQSRDKGGFVKAMAMVHLVHDGFGGSVSSATITRCFNGILNSSSSGCGMSVAVASSAVTVDFGFTITDRFVSVTGIGDSSSILDFPTTTSARILPSVYLTDFFIFVY